MEKVTGFQRARGYLSVYPAVLRYSMVLRMQALIRIETVFIILVVMNLVGLTIAAYVVMRKK